MSIIPTQIENPSGLHQRYIIQKIVPTDDIRYADGLKVVDVDPRAEYFVLRLDFNGQDKEHISACRHAVLHYAGLIQHHIPGLAKDLSDRYADPIEAGRKQAYSRSEVINIIDDLLQYADAVMDAIQSESPKMDAEELLEMVEWGNSEKENQKS